MYESRIVSGLAVVLGGTAVLFAGLAVAYNPVFLAVAFVFGASAFLVWYHASGRFARRIYRGVESQASVDAAASSGAGPRGNRDPPRDGRRTRAQSGGRAGVRGRRPGVNDRRAGENDRRRRTRTTAGDGRERDRRRTRARGSGPPSAEGLTAREAYETLGLEPDADDETVRTAYREKVKEVHPDRPAGDEDEFKRVNAAYERLSGD